MSRKRTSDRQFAGRKRVLYASDWWLEELMNSVAHYATAHGWHLDLQMVLTNEEPESWSGDGILTTRAADREDDRRLFAESGCPVVSLNLNASQQGIPTVNADVRQLSRLAADHLSEKGFRTFAVYVRKHEYSVSRIHSEFEDAVKDLNQSCFLLDWLQERGRAADTWANRQKWLEKKLAELPRPVGIFIPSVGDTVEVFDACVAAHLHVPDDVAILAAYGIPFFRECTPVPLSSVNHDHDTQARIACDLLEQLMAGGSPPDGPIYIPPKGLTARASTDTLAASTPEVTKAIRYMLDHYAEPMSIEDAVRVSGMSRTRLVKHFKQDLDQTPHVVLTRIRMDQAKRMLRDTNETLETVAEACGFGHPVGLHHHFRKALKISPGAYRKQAAEKNTAEGDATSTASGKC
jgi:LacI family transcriptional regulator